MKRLNISPLAASFVFVWLAATPSVASPIFFQNSVGLLDPETAITFSEITLPDGTLIGDEYADFGVSFEGVYYNPQSGMGAPNFSGPTAGNFSAVGSPPQNVTNSFSIHFLVPVSGAAVALISSQGETRFEALLNGVVLATATAPSDYVGVPNYYGFAGAPFDELRMTNDSGGVGGDDAAIIDGVQLTPVPEPSSLALLAIGLGAGRAWRRRRI